MMSWGSAADGASKAGNMVESSSANTAPAMSSGFSIEPANTGTSPGVNMDAGNIPTDGTSVSMTPNQNADVASYGTSNPTFMDKAVNLYDRFSKGGQQGAVDTYKNFGNNAETYGAAYGMVNKMAGAGKQGGGAAPITTNISYQQPENPYLKKRGRY